jgi:ectoine hydroxylase-related dioxygenase (phytanoyl-CoA dioxygenase family)
MSNTISHYGINKFTTQESDFEKYGEEIRIKGYTVIENVLNEEEVLEGRKRLRKIYDTQLAELGDEKIISTINDSDIARALLVYDDFFLKTIATNGKIIPVIRHLLGNYFILREQNGIINRPNLPNYQLKWHRDILYQNFIVSTPLAISVLFCLDDFNVKTGGTHVLPSSHKIDAFPSTGYVEKNEICVNAKAGSAIAFDAMLLHRAGYNSADHERRAVNNVYALPFIKQPISFPQVLKGQYSEDSFLNMFLGYDSDTDASVYDWRMRRYNRISKK